MKKIAIIYFSYSCQTAKLVQAIKKGFEESGIEAHSLRLRPKVKLTFPFNSTFQTISMMIKTFFRKRVPIYEVDLSFLEDVDIVFLGGPTWSYNPSGPILYFLDKYGEFLSGKKVVPIISCRKYWHHHFNYLKKKISSKGAVVEDPWIFNHKVKSEPWSAIGTFLTLAGKNPKHHPLIRKYYPKYGHARKEFDRARQLAKEFGQKMKELS